MSVQRVIDNKKIGANIRLARVKKMMSQSELAKLLGVTQTHMSNLERGRCGITVTMLNQLTNLFDVETDSLLYGTPAIRPKAEATDSKKYRHCQMRQCRFFLFVFGV